MNARQRQPWPKGRDFRILSIDGGGIKGIFPATFLAALERIYLYGETIAAHFDMIVGTSTGGVIAIGLGAGLTSREIRDLYRDRGEEIFPPQSVLTRWVNCPLHFIRYKYNTTVLRKILYEYLSDRTLAQSLSRLCIPSSDGDGGDICVFKTPHHPDYHLDADREMLTVALATSAAPTFFRILEEDGNLFVDGGVWSNNPIMIGVVEALTAFDVKPDQIKVLSLGSGSPRFRASERMVKYGGLLPWRKVIFAAMHFQSESALGQARLLIGPERVTRIDAPTMKNPIDLDDWKRATTELMPAAQLAVENEGDSVAAEFLATEVDPYVPPNPNDTAKTRHSSNREIETKNA